MKPPLVLHLRSRDGVSYNLRGDGTATLSYCLPEYGWDVSGEPHAVKLLYTHGLSKPAYISASFVKLQGHNSDYSHILGTTLPGTNVYVPVGTHYVAGTGWVTIANMDGSPIQKLEPICLAMHLVPCDPLWMS